MNRRKTCPYCVQLSDPNDYEGGVFQCWFGGDGRFIDLPRQKGECVGDEDIYSKYQRKSDY